MNHNKKKSPFPINRDKRKARRNEFRRGGRTYGRRGRTAKQMTLKELSRIAKNALKAYLSFKKWRGHLPAQ